MGLATLCVSIKAGVRKWQSEQYGGRQEVVNRGWRKDWEIKSGGEGDGLSQREVIYGRKSNQNYILDKLF